MVCGGGVVGCGGVWRCCSEVWRWCSGEHKTRQKHNTANDAFARDVTCKECTGDPKHR